MQSVYVYVIVLVISVPLESSKKFKVIFVMSLPESIWKVSVSSNEISKCIKLIDHELVLAMIVKWLTLLLN